MFNEIKNEETCYIHVSCNWPAWRVCLDVAGDLRLAQVVRFASHRLLQDYSDTFYIVFWFVFCNLLKSVAASLEQNSEPYIWIEFWMFLSARASFTSTYTYPFGARNSNGEGTWSPNGEATWSPNGEGTWRSKGEEHEALMAREHEALTARQHEALTAREHVALKARNMKP